MLKQIQHMVRDDRVDDRGNDRNAVFKDETKVPININSIIFGNYIDWL